VILPPNFGWIIRNDQGTNVLFLDEIKKILEFLPTGEYCNIFNGKFTRCLLGLDIDYGTGELKG
jgi:hypothetical protein